MTPTSLHRTEQESLALTFCELEPDVLVVRTRGQLDLATAPDLDAELNAALLRTRPRSVLLELSGLRFLDLHGAAVLERARRHAAGRGVALGLVALPPVARRALMYAGTLRRFGRYPDLATASSEVRR